jgi:hypothetical protein
MKKATHFCVGQTDHEGLVNSLYLCFNRRPSSRRP